MSYEGYVQLLCAWGHYREIDCYQDEPKICGFKGCEQPIVWRNGVDTTNGSFEGRKRIDGHIKLKLEDEIKCKSCGSVLETFYKIPRKKGKLFAGKKIKIQRS